MTPGPCDAIDMRRDPNREGTLKRTILMVAGIAMAAALVAGGTTASATSHHKAKVAPAKVTQLQKLSRLDGQFISLTKRVKPCAGSAGQIKAAGAM